MASPLFRIHNANLAGWKTGSRKIVGLKMEVWKDKKIFFDLMVDHCQL